MGYFNKPYGCYVRAVRGGQCGSFDNYVDNGDGTVSDTDTELMWQKATDLGTYTWQQVLPYCENLILNNDGEWTNGTPNVSGVKYDDWRLPNRNELQSLVDYSRHVPAINTTYFPNTVSSYYWSSTTYASSPNTAWLIYFHDGYLFGPYDKSSYGCYVRAVRGGQCGSLCPTEMLYREHSEETEFLRSVRDNILSQTPEGQEIIRLYYEWSPSIVKAMEENEEFKQEMKVMIDGVLPLIR